MLKRQSSRAFLLILLILLPSTQPRQINCFPTNAKYQKKFDYPIMDGTSIISTIYDDTVIVVDDQDKDMSFLLRLNGVYEEYNTATQGRFVKEGDTILNIGCQYGLEAIVLAKLAGPKGRLLLFEPYTKSYKSLLKSVHLNGLGQNTMIYRVAAGNKNTNAYIVIFYENTSASQVYTDENIEKAAKGYDEIEKVPMRRADSVIPEDIKIDFALIDVERLELQVLEGLKKVVERSPNMVMAVEWCGFTIGAEGNYESRMRKLLQWFTQQNYKFYKTVRRSEKDKKTECLIDDFIQLSPDQVIQYGEQLDKTRVPPDLYFVPKHINPNNIH